MKFKLKIALKKKQTDKDHTDDTYQKWCTIFVHFTNDLNRISGAFLSSSQQHNIICTITLSTISISLCLLYVHMLSSDHHVIDSFQLHRKCTQHSSQYDSMFASRISSVSLFLCGEKTNKTKKNRMNTDFDYHTNSRKTRMCKRKQKKKRLNE